MILTRKLQNSGTAGRYFRGVSWPNLHGEGGFPLGRPPAVFSADAAVPVAQFSLFSDLESRSLTPVFPSTAHSADSAERFADELFLAPPGRRQRAQDKSRQSKVGGWIFYIVGDTDKAELHPTYWKFRLNKVGLFIKNWNIMPVTHWRWWSSNIAGQLSLCFYLQPSQLWTCSTVLLQLAVNYSRLLLDTSSFHWEHNRNGCETWSGHGETADSPINLI